MKSVFALIIALVFVLSLAACGSGDKKDETAAEATEAVTEAPASDAELCAEFAVEKLKEVLTNPSSLVVNQLHGVQDEDSYVFEIDYTAENELGGSSRDYFYVSVSTTDNGFVTHSIGSANFADETSQGFTKQIYYEKAASGYFDFDTTTYRYK